jgi:hypothetical protein
MAARWRPRGTRWLPRHFKWWISAGIVVIAGLVMTSRLVRLAQTVPFTSEGGLNPALSSLADRPNEDVPGRDLKTVPRCSGGLRLFYGKDEMPARGTIFHLIYRCPGSLADVSAFYEIEMARLGWKLEVKDEHFFHMFFVRADRPDAVPPAVQLQFEAHESETVVSVLAMDRP